MRVMTEAEQHDLEAVCNTVRAMVSALRLIRSEDEDLQVAAARLANWLTENDGRWTK